jgi:hypothetical protein
MDPSVDSPIDHAMMFAFEPGIVAWLETLPDPDRHDARRQGACADAGSIHHAGVSGTMLTHAQASGRSRGRSTAKFDFALPSLLP